jgi:translation elongation factor EF-1alpha
MGGESKEEAVGVVLDYFRKAGVGAVEVTRGTIRIGDVLKFRGHTTDFVQRIDSIQVNHQAVKEAVEGDLIGIKVDERVREGDLVFLEGGKPEGLL